MLSLSLKTKNCMMSAGILANADADSLKEYYSYRDKTDAMKPEDLNADGLISNTELDYYDEKKATAVATLNRMWYGLVNATSLEEAESNLDDLLYGTGETGTGETGTGETGHQAKLAQAKLAQDMGLDALCLGSGCRISSGDSIAQVFRAYLERVTKTTIRQKTTKVKKSWKTPKPKPAMATAEVQFQRRSTVPTATQGGTNKVDAL